MVLAPDEQVAADDGGGMVSGDDQVRHEAKKELLSHKRLLIFMPER